MVSMDARYLFKTFVAMLSTSVLLVTVFFLCGWTSVGFQVVAMAGGFAVMAFLLVRHAESEG